MSIGVPTVVEDTAGAATRSVEATWDHVDALVVQVVQLERVEQIEPCEQVAVGELGGQAELLGLGSTTMPATMPATGPRLFYGWWMLGLAMLAAIATSPGQTFGVSIFNEPLRIEMQLTHGQLALAYMIGTLLGAIPITWFGRMMDRHGIRRLTLVILVAFSAACWVVATAGSWWTLVLGFTLLRMLGPGALSLMSANILPFWFNRRLGMVEGLRQTAMAVAMAIIPAINLWLVTQFGWRGGYVILGLCVLGLWPLYWYLLRNRPRDVQQRVDGLRPVAVGPSVSAGDSDDEAGPDFTLRQALRTAVFWAALLNGALYSLIHTGVFFCLLPILAEQGLDASYAAWMLMVFAISLAVHQMAGGWLADRVAPGIQMIVGQGLFAVGLGLFVLAGGGTEVLVAGGVMGAAQGVFFAASNPIWARYFGLPHLGAIRGFLMSFHVALSSIGPLVVGWSHDMTGDFGLVLSCFAALPLLLAAGLLLVRPPQKATEAISAGRFG